mgnify:CR=1 FL=1
MINFIYLKINRLYSVTTVLFALVVFCQSPLTYERIREFLTLPGKRYFQQIKSDLDDTPEFEKTHYLSYILSTLNKMKKIMSLLVDKIYLKRALQYKSKKIIGHADNDANTYIKYKKDIYSDNNAKIC